MWDSDPIRRPPPSGQPIHGRAKDLVTGPAGRRKVHATCWRFHDNTDSVELEMDTTT
jgi:hypothetical protein